MTVRMCARGARVFHHLDGGPLMHVQEKDRINRWEREISRKRNKDRIKRWREREKNSPRQKERE